MKNKFITLSMLGIIISQIFAPTVYNVNLMASEVTSNEVQSEVDNTESEQTTNDSSAVEDEAIENSEATSEVASDIESSQNEEEIIDENSSENSSNFSLTPRNDNGITLVETNPTEVYSGDSITNRVEISLNPTDTGSILNEGEKWSTFKITLDPEFVLNETFGIEITQSTPNIITDYEIITNADGSTTIDFTLDQDAIAMGGQTIGIIFVTEIDEGIDLSDYFVNVELCGDQDTCYSEDTSVLYHDPTVMDITKEMTNPKYAAAGEEITYEITMVANGTGDITIDPMPQIVDQLPANVEYISSTPEGVYDGSTVTWDWTAEDIANRSKNS